MTNFLKLTGSFWINLYFLNMKFHEKIFTTIKVIQLWNFGNFGTSEIIPKNLVTLRFLKVSLHELKFSCKTFQLSHWPNFYFDPAYSNTRFPWNTMRLKTNAHDCILANFQAQDKKLAIFLEENQHTQRKLCYIVT